MYCLDAGWIALERLYPRSYRPRKIPHTPLQELLHTEHLVFNGVARALQRASYTSSNRFC